MNPFESFRNFMNEHPFRWLGWYMVTMLVLLTLFSLSASAATATLTWTLPTQREDGTALPTTAIQGFEIDFGLCATGNAFPTTPAGTQTVTGAVTTANVTVPGYGAWCFRARTVDTGGLESANSNTVYKVYVAPPRPPVLVTVNIVAYDINATKSGYRVARQVGTIELGIECGQKIVDSRRGADYHEVPIDKVTLMRMPKSAIVVAKCEVEG